MDVTFSKIVKQNISANLQMKILQIYKVFTSLYEKKEPSEIFVSFNGGKDCTVLLHILKTYSGNRPIPRVIYIQPENSFKEVEDFIKECEKTYRIQIERQKGAIKNALTDICTRNPSLKAVIMGCRRTDPYCSHLKTFEYTDPDWPKLLRVNPLLDWSYNDIWEYIREFNIPYCKLYDQGYTSIGDTTNTAPNPNLIEVDKVTGITKYKPADCLASNSQERAGRK